MSLLHFMFNINITAWPYTLTYTRENKLLLLLLFLLLISTTVPVRNPLMMQSWQQNRNVQAICPCLTYLYICSRMVMKKTVVEKMQDRHSFLIHRQTMEKKSKHFLLFIFMQFVNISCTETVDFTSIWPFQTSESECSQKEIHLLGFWSTW